MLALAAARRHHTPHRRDCPARHITIPLPVANLERPRDRNQQFARVGTAAVPSRCWRGATTHGHLSAGRGYAESAVTISATPGTRPDTTTFSSITKPGVLITP